MEYVSSNELRELIFDEINSTIETHRESDENYFWCEHNPPATEQEIDDFILSIPYFTKELKRFLLNDFFGVQEMLMSEEWKEEFMQNVNMWAKNSEWLNGNGLLIRHPYSLASELKTEPLGYVRYKVKTI